MKKKFIKFITFITVITLITFIIFRAFRPSPVAASWFDDSFAYRNAIAITSHTAAENNVYISATIDTSTSGQFQADCGDLRFTDYAGNQLPYYIVSGCGTAATVIHVFFQSFPAGAQTIYYYYGNPSADNGFSASDFTTEAAGYVIGATGSQEKGGAPVAYWKFDDGTGTNTQDSSPNNNDGTITGATWQTSDQCVSDKCLSFDGTNDVVTVANSVAGVQSVSFWVRPITTTEQFVDLNGSAYIQASSGTVSATGFTSPTIYVDGKVSSTIVANKWQHISVTTASALTGSAVKVGQISTNYGQAFFDDIKIYDYARTAAQIKSDFKSRGTAKGSSVSLSSRAGVEGSLSNGLVGYWKMDEAAANSCTGGVNDSCDTSGNGLDGAWNGTNIGSTAGKYGNGVNFNGTDDYVSLGSNSIMSGSSSTLSLWFRVNAFGGVFVGKSADNDTYIYPSNSTTINIQTDTISTEKTFTVPTMSTGIWYHLVVTRDNNTTHVYLNGTESTSGGQSQTQDLTINQFGRYSSYPGYWYNGRLDEIKLYNRALSPREVRDLYNWAPGPRVYLKMEEGSGTSANDDSGNGRTGTLQGNPIWAPGKYGKGVKLDGTGDYTQVSDF